MFQPPYIYLFIVAIALLWDTIVPDIAWVWHKIPHPIAVLGRLIIVFEKRLYRPTKLAGMVFAMCVIAIWGAVGFFIEYTIFTHTPYGVGISIFTVSILLASNAMTRAVKRIMIAIDRGDLKSARRQTGGICTRYTGAMSASDCGRTALESMAENLSDGVIAPAFYYAVFGMGGLFVYKAINTLDSMVGYPSKKYRRFGWASAKLDDVANYIPARLSAVLVVMATITYGKSHPKSAVAAIYTYAHTHNSPNAGYPESAFAGGLQIAFGGKRYYPDVGEIDHWIGDNRRDITPKIMMQGVRLFNRTIYVSIAILTVMLIYI